MPHLLLHAITILYYAFYSGAISHYFLAANSLALTLFSDKIQIASYF